MGALYSQLIVGLINGCFYALLSLGLAVIFGMLNIVNFAHGAFFMTGAFVAWIGLTQLGPWMGSTASISYWWALLLVPLTSAGLASSSSVATASPLQLDPLYGMLLTFALAWILEGCFDIGMARQAVPTKSPTSLWCLRSRVPAATSLSRMGRRCRARCLSCTWFLIERTKLGSYLRAATENPKLVEAFGINVPR